MSAGKVLVVLSGCHSIALCKKDNSKIDQDTGFLLQELAQPLQELLDNNFEVTFASPGGEEPRMDPISDSALWFLGNYAELNREKALLNSLSTSLQNPLPFHTLTETALSAFSGIFIPGGHGPMGDLGNDQELGRILSHFHEHHKPTGVICHGPIALLSTQPFAYKGYKVTCYPNKEEMANEVVWGAKLERKVEDALREAGAQVEVAAAPLVPKVVVDRELVSGEGPSSALQLGRGFVGLLREGVKDEL
ncbi:ThiJ/PfpI family protein [Choiromyces venosus 120613-1]|uniref:D-lactate dehydratase n=1 Tax=Choiromyces venosus 120613-1 TaxID=1336337 RepID=A0A3N4J8M3_9PEZI|nr:ThiJ/PfpI family protein [Choiromyces venosus 120613-1]